ncbi:MAG: phytanoyl-CoA dioxygenase family protein [Gammaproteobacteria bacterium]|jgi:ectoine hydroxylase-related dioxygenase (phytanoyl-CoA dioxygenase family)|nr:MAG: phytanoyl-CoA dioxygenase family protein [Gammaproteobacteria bacterium]
MPKLQKLPISTPTEEILEVILRDGALILTDALSEADLAVLNAELKPYMEATPTGRDDFTGRSTTRTGALVARSPKTRELVMNEAVLAAVGRFLDPYCHRFQLHLTQIIRLMPGQGKQAIHRDRWAWGKYLQGIEPQLNTIWALSDFTEENGATQVVPGSVEWPDDRQAMPEEICQAVMPAGSLLLYTGSVFHAGGENRSNGDRVGLNITYSLGWLRQEENQFLSCPPEIAKELEPGLQDLLGYTQGSYALGYYTPPLPPGEGPEIVGPEHAVGRKAGQLGEADAELLESLQNS